MRTIAIILGDNDFLRTFEPLLESIKNIYSWSSCWNDRSLTQEEIRKIILEGIRYHYLAFQVTSHRGRWDTEGAERLDQTVEYLKTGIRILFDDEAEQDILHEDHDSGAWYLDLQTGKIESY